MSDKQKDIEQLLAETKKVLEQSNDLLERFRLFVRKLQDELEQKGRGK